jgi:hypothetical protein
MLSLIGQVDRVYITGHSLGGAMTSIFAMMAAREFSTRKIANPNVVLPSLHCVTFGAPSLFSDEARNAFNKYLLDGTMTLDRVTANADIITSVPGVGFNHPGFRNLKTELYAASKTGRSSEINELRSIFLGADKIESIDGVGISELPTDPAFWDLFTPVPNENITLETRLRNYSRVAREKDPNFVKFVLPDITIGPEDVQPVLTPEEQAAQDKQEAEQIAADASVVPAQSEVQEGGGFLSTITSRAAAAATAASSKLSLTAATRNYKSQALVQAPNRINYQCYKRLSAGFCHGAYMGIGFLGGIRVPIVRVRGADGKLQTKIFRRLEPTLVTDFLGNSEQMSPQIRYYAVASKNATGGYRRRRRQTKKMRVKRRLRKTKVFRK